jgi:hypothetical protein
MKNTGIRCGGRLLDPLNEFRGLAIVADVVA